LKQINLGIIGLGNEGKLILRKSLWLKGARIEAVADLSEKARSAAKGSGVKNVYGKYEDLLKDDNIDGVIISLPNFLHQEAAVKSAEAGKHILLEKPFARNVKEGEKILSAVRKNSVKLMVGYDMRFDHVLSGIHDQIANGFFGEVQIAEATNISGGPFSPRSDSIGPVRVPSWWLDKELAGGGALLDLGSHLVDLLIWYFGEVASASSFLKYMFRTDLEDAATCILEFKNGPVATVKVGWFSKGFIQSLQVCGTAKNTLVQLAPENTSSILWKGIVRKFGRNKNDSYYLELQHFVSCLQKDEQPQPSGEEGLRSLQAISLAYRNAQTVV
jgi:myo-inositol 2-dehydrogenase/D-chiro-inositol 1-dehydrogenase